MSIDTQIELKTNYIYLRCNGTFEQSAAIELFGNAIQTAVQEGRKAVLIDARELEGEPPTTMERYELGASLAEFNSRGILIVVVGKEPIIDPSRFGETVAVNRGVRGRAFTDIDEAITWLEEKIVK